MHFGDNYDVDPQSNCDLSVTIVNPSPPAELQLGDACQLQSGVRHIQDFYNKVSLQEYIRLSSDQLLAINFTDPYVKLTRIH